MVTGPQILDWARDRYERNRQLPMPEGLSIGADWKLWSEKAAWHIPHFNNVLDVIGYGQTHAMSGFNHRMEVDREILVYKHQDIVARYKNYEFVVGDSPFAKTMLTLFDERDGKRTVLHVSNIFYWHLQAYLSISRYIGPEPRHVLEIGGGMGELARIFLSHYQPVSYTIVDLPTSLFFAEVYLRLHFPDRMGYVDFVPIQHGHLSDQWQVDQIINQGSMQEMDAETVAYWCNFINESEATGFYSLNDLDTPLTLDESWTEAHREQPGIITVDAGDRFMETCWTREK